MKGFFAETAEFADHQEVREEIDRVVNSITKLPEAEQPEAISHFMKKLDAELGDEALEYILVIMGTRLRNGHW